MDLGDIDGIPRILDAGQCNDCYSLVKIALALQEATGVASINDLPIALDISWYDQKSVGIVLALAALGVRKIRIGPTWPAFLQSVGGRRFTQKYDIFAAGTVESDLAAICALGQIGCSESDLFRFSRLLFECESRVTLIARQLIGFMTLMAVCARDVAGVGQVVFVRILV